MTNIGEFNKANLHALRGDISAALKTINDKYGIDMAIGSISYQKSSFSAKLTAVSRAASGGATPDGVDPKWVSDFLSNYSSYGLEKSDLGRSFMFNRERVTLVGSRVRAKLQIIIQKASGKFSVIAADSALSGLAKEKK